NDYQFVVNMQLAMYQMLTNLATNPSTPPSSIPALRFRPAPDYQAPIINHQKSLKRLGPKRQRLVKTNLTSE
ncbi:unnamed protein product, partial [Adineta steineri]